nr:reverse transcriptase domain-containing protein [Tanacetum cinerariifolium]
STAGVDVVLLDVEVVTKSAQTQRVDRVNSTLINLVQSNQFTGRQDPHNHLRFFNKVTSTFRHPEVPNTTIKLLLFPFSLEGVARIWLDKEPPRSILTWEDLVSKFINQFFPPSKTTYLRNEITNFLQKPNETFNEAWERFKDLLRQCPHHRFSELRQLDTFYNALNPNDQDALDSVAGGNSLDKIPRECLSITESKSKVRYSRSRVIDVRANANDPPPSSSNSNSFDLQQIVESLEDKLNIRMNRFEKSLNDMKNSFITPTAPLKAVEETAAVGNFIQNRQNVSNQMRPSGFNQPTWCAKCGHPINGPYYQGCALLREKLEEDLVTYLKYFQDTSESSDDNTNVINAPREPFVVKQDHGVKSSQNPPHIDKCCCECGEALDGIFCQQCICKSCGKGAHTGYNCPPKVLIISNPEPCNQTINNELPQTLPSFDPTCYSDNEKSVHCVSKPNFVDESSKIFNPPPQLPIYSCEFCRNNAQYGHYCAPLAQFNNLEQGYSQDFNFPQNIHNFQQQYFCCDQCGGPHEPFQCFDQTQPPQFLVIHPPPQETSIEILHDQENIVNSVQTFLRKFNCYSFFETPKVLLLAWDRVFEIKDALGTKQYKPEDIQELFRQLLNDVQNIHEELAEYINTPGWNRPAFYDDDDDDDDVDYTIAITPVLSTEEPIDSLTLKDNPTPSFDCKTKSSSTSLNSFLEKTNTFHDSLPEFENFYFDLGEISSGSTTTHSGTSLPDYEAFYFDDDHVKEISSGSTTTHSGTSLPDYEAFYFDDDHVKEISSG